MSNEQKKEYRVWILSTDYWDNELGGYAHVDKNISDVPYHECTSEEFTALTTGARSEKNIKIFWNRIDDLPLFERLLKTGKEIIEKTKLAQKRQQDRLKKSKEESAEKAKRRKLKQLQKLKKELGEE